MTIEVRAGNIFHSDAHALVNPVNCVGVMGAGLASQFRKRYPGMFARYVVLCRNGAITPGSVMFDDGDGRWIANFATKDHWLHDSRIEWIDSGLEALARHIREEGVPTIAVPPLGCGYGGLDYREVLPLMLKHLGDLDCRVILYVSEGDLGWAQDLVAASGS